jgi:tetratricopeptide (TPR) repeat protein
MRPIPKVALLICALVFSRRIQAQDSPLTKEARSLLREASALIPEIHSIQRSIVATNLAGQQARIGDVEGAMVTARLDGDANSFMIGIIASSLASQGNRALAVELIRESEGNPDGKAQGYLFVSQQLANRHDFADALQVARLIQQGPASFARSNQLVQVLLWIHSKQVEAGDTASAESTINEALDAAEEEIENPSDRFGESLTAGLFGRIAGELARDGNRGAALAVLERIYGMIAAAGDPKAKQLVLFQLADAQGNIGELESAMSTAEQLTDGQRKDIIKMLITRQRIK